MNIFCFIHKSCTYKSTKKCVIKMYTLYNTIPKYATAVYSAHSRVTGDPLIPPACTTDSMYNV